MTKSYIAIEITVAKINDIDGRCSNKRFMLITMVKITQNFFKIFSDVKTHLINLIAGITDRCLFWFSYGGGGSTKGTKAAQAVLSFHGAFLCFPFQKKYVVCLYKCSTIVMINKCGAETGKVPFVFSM